MRKIRILWDVDVGCWTVRAGSNLNYSTPRSSFGELLYPAEISCGAIAPQTPYTVLQGCFARILSTRHKFWDIFFCKAFRIYSRTRCVVSLGCFLFWQNMTNIIQSTVQGVTRLIPYKFIINIFKMDVV